MRRRFVVLDEILGGHIRVAGLARLFAYVQRRVRRTLVFRSLPVSFGVWFFVGLGRRTAGRGLVRPAVNRAGQQQPRDNQRQNKEHSRVRRLRHSLPLSPDLPSCNSDRLRYASVRCGEGPYGSILIALGRITNL